MRLLLLADGRSVHTVRFQKELINQGVQVVLASLERGETVDILLKRRSVSNSLSYFFSNREIKELIYTVAPDAVNAHFASGYGFSTALSRVWKRLPVFLHCLGSDILVSPAKSIAHKRKVMYALSRAHHIFVDSEYLAGKVRGLCTESCIDVIPWGVENEFLGLFNRKREKGFVMHRPLRVIVPRPQNRIYNNKFIITSLEELLIGGEITLTFLDSGDDRDGLKALALERCPGGLIDFYGFKPRDEYIGFISGFDIYLSASLSDSSPASLIEAMAAGLFPVVADIPGVREWMDSDSGILFDPKVGETLVAAFRRLLDPDMNVRRILTSNHDRVSARGVFTDNVRATIHVMRQVVNNGV